jgi:ABC-type sugar transport system substrate-binding protein
MFHQRQLRNANQQTSLGVTPCQTPHNSVFQKSTAWLMLRLGGFFLFLLLVGCSEKKDSNAPKKMAIIISTLNNPWFVFLADNAAAKAKELGYETKIFDSQNNTALESDHFENALVSGYSAVLFNPTDAEGSVVNVRKAKAAGVPVFCMDREINATDAATSQILSDSYSGCVELAKLFVQQTNKKGTYVELLGLVGDNNTWARSQGFHSVVDNYPSLKMVAQQSADFDRNKAMDVMESILQANPNIDAVFCGNDAMAMGAYQALAAAGKASKVKVFGFDGADDVVSAIKDGKIVATGMQFPKVMAQTAAIYADEYLKGKREFAQKLPVAVELVTKKNIENYAAFGKKEQ